MLRHAIPRWVLLDEGAHRPACLLVPAALPHDAVVAGVYRSERCPLACPRCRHPFETLFSYQLEPLDPDPRVL